VCTLSSPPFLLIGQPAFYNNAKVRSGGENIVTERVALTVRDKSTLEYELHPLRLIRDHYPKILLTMDEDPEVQYDGIRRINARGWLLT